MLLGTLTNPVHPEFVEGCSNREISVGICPSTGSGRTAFEAAWQRIAEHFDTPFTTEHSIDQLKQTILQLAVMGKLVPQNPNDEPASVLLEKIAEEKARLVKRQRKQTKIKNEEKPHSLPVGWEWCRVRDICNFLNGYAFKSEWFTQTGIKLLRNINILHGQTRWIDIVLHRRK